LRSGMSKFPQIMINVPLSGAADVMASPSVATAVKDAESLMHGRGRVLLRPSGTEPLIRVMVEGEDEALVRQQAEYLAEVVARTVQQEAQPA
jgi:phosphoglucosamine mutase